MTVKGLFNELEVSGPSDLLMKVSKMKEDGARLMGIVADDLGDGKLVLKYVFDKDGKVTHLNWTVPMDQQIETMSTIFPQGLVFEAEVMDMFGVSIKGVPKNFFMEPAVAEMAPLRRSPKKEGIP